jgi:hypothetical protein
MWIHLVRRTPYAVIDLSVAMMPRTQAGFPTRFSTVPAEPAPTAIRRALRSSTARVARTLQARGPWVRRARQARRSGSEHSEMGWKQAGQR